MPSMYISRQKPDGTAAGGSGRLVSAENRTASELDKEPALRSVLVVAAQNADPLGPSSPRHCAQSGRPSGRSCGQRCGGSPGGGSAASQFRGLLADGRCSQAVLGLPLHHGCGSGESGGLEREAERQRGAGERALCPSFFVM